MPNYANADIRKIKLIKIYEMLKQDSDENNPLSTSAIIKRRNIHQRTKTSGGRAIVACPHKFINIHQRI